MPKLHSSRYYITVGKQPVPEPADITQMSEREIQVTWRDRTWTVDALGIAGGSLSLLNGNRSYSIELEQKGDAFRVSFGEAHARVSVIDERGYRMQGAVRRHAVEGRQTVSAPMPGKVVRVLVKPGDDVRSGQGLVVVEAMKMENELKSPKDGKVGEIFVREGQAVEGGAGLVIVE